MSNKDEVDGDTIGPAIVGDVLSTAKLHVNGKVTDEISKPLKKQQPFKMTALVWRNM